MAISLAVTSVLGASAMALARRGRSGLVPNAMATFASAGGRAHLVAVGLAAPLIAVPLLCRLADRLGL